MNRAKIQLGQTVLRQSDNQVQGNLVEIDGEKFYSIEHYDLMPDFFMTIVSDSDQWMFISSNGSLSAGRKDRDHAIFPYYTDDKIHDYYDRTGSKTVILVQKGGNTLLWQPFSKELAAVYSIERKLLKSIYGNKIIFQERNLDLGLEFRYGWYTSNDYGFVKKSALVNFGDELITVRILDGIRNILPAGVDYNFQNEYSNLLDGYKKSELIEKTKLGLFMLSSIPVDKAEPSESLKATTVWSTGLADSRVLISDRQIANFKSGAPLHTETDIRASRGAYFLNAEISLHGQKAQEWLFVCEANQSTADVANLNHFLSDGNNLVEIISADIKKGTDRLVSYVAYADGLQKSHDELGTARHFSNVLFNIMRGGVFVNNYMVPVDDLKRFIKETNRVVAAEAEVLLAGKEEEISIQDLHLLAEQSGDPDLIRIFDEYLPLTFSRRHGDPSRPWNQFSIDNKNPDGSPRFDFQGNWRDIFQNWEALSISFPGFAESIISKFVNATTADGYNPYRIMRDGIDWESPDPDDPWAYIGYWGDHQIIYLQKLLELSESFHPGKIDHMLVEEVYAYANVPYRIKPYDEIIRDPKNTILFNAELNKQIRDLVAEKGSDARLLANSDQTVYHVNLTEKILVLILAKLVNFIPEAGIWLNTQRPEWNDANNALVGNGASMVTLCYLRRFLSFWKMVFDRHGFASAAVSSEVKKLFDNVSSHLSANTHLLEKGFTDRDRRNFTDALGEAGTVYRQSIYNSSFSGDKAILGTSQLVQFLTLSIRYIDQSISKNRRTDGLYHSYNLVTFDGDAISIRHLYEMLEGQVAVLSSGYLSSSESLEVVSALKHSALFRADQYSYLLYPDRRLPLFTEKNNIPSEKVRESELLAMLIADKETSIVIRDTTGGLHFHGSFRNAGILESALESLDYEKYGHLVRKEKAMILDIYEKIFDHQSFTGRSGTFYAYEGLGSIYWHMVSKLLLASQECYFRAVDEGEETALSEQLKEHYFDIKAGIGTYKSPDLYGAFPTDAYSHTPGNSGARQPGMTGQVKEDVISRMRELGIKVEEGRIRFDPSLLSKDEFLTAENHFEYVTVEGKTEQLPLLVNQLAFTFCQVPVVYTLDDRQEIEVVSHGADVLHIPGDTVDLNTSNLIFSRSGVIKLLRVSVRLQS
jgi:hypothetical protein